MQFVTIVLIQFAIQVASIEWAYEVGDDVNTDKLTQIYICYSFQNNSLCEHCWKHVLPHLAYLNIIVVEYQRQVCASSVVAYTWRTLHTRRHENNRHYICILGHLLGINCCCMMYVPLKERFCVCLMPTFFRHTTSFLRLERTPLLVCNTKCQSLRTKKGKKKTVRKVCDRVQPCVYSIYQTLKPFLYAQRERVLPFNAPALQT